MILSSQPREDSLGILLEMVALGVLVGELPGAKLPPKVVLHPMVEVEVELLVEALGELMVEVVELKPAPGEKKELMGGTEVLRVQPGGPELQPT